MIFVPNEKEIWEVENMVFCQKQILWLILRVLNKLYWFYLLFSGFYTIISKNHNNYTFVYRFVSKTEGLFSTSSVKKYERPKMYVHKRNRIFHALLKMFNILINKNYMKNIY